MENLNIKQLTRMVLLILGIVVVQSYGIEDPNNVEFESENFSEDENSDLDGNAGMQNDDEGAQADTEEDYSEDENSNDLESLYYFEDSDSDKEIDLDDLDNGDDCDTEDADYSDDRSDIPSDEDDFIYNCPLGYKPNGVNHE